MDNRKAVEARVLAFIEDHADWENDCLKQQVLDGSPECPCDIIDFSNPEGSIKEFQDHSARQFDDAAARMEILCRKHCTQHDLLTRRGVGYGTPLTHDPLVEHIVGVDLNGSGALVETESIGGRYAGFEYTLVVQKGEWRISNIQSFLATEDAPEKPDWSDVPGATEFSVFDDADIDFQKAFKAKGEVKVFDSEDLEKLSLSKAGEVEVPSGYLTVVAPGYTFGPVRPLEVRVEKRACKVDLVRAGIFNAFVRVVFGDFAKATAFVPARWMGDGEEAKPASVCSRVGFIFIVDAETWAALPERDVERFSHGLYDEGSGRTKDGVRGILSSNRSGVLIERGGGDYDCPMYWAIDGNGAPQALVIDLSQCGSYEEQAFDFPATERLVEASGLIPQLTEFGISVRFRREGDQIAVLYKSKEGLNVDVIDSKQRVVASTEQSGFHTSEDDERVQYIPSAPERLDGFRFRCRWSSWQHAFARM